MGIGTVTQIHHPVTPPPVLPSPTPMPAPPRPPTVPLPPPPSGRWETRSIAKRHRKHYASKTITFRVRCTHGIHEISLCDNGPYHMSAHPNLEHAKLAAGLADNTNKCLEIVKWSKTKDQQAWSYFRRTCKDKLIVGLLQGADMQAMKVNLNQLSYNRRSDRASSDILLGSPSVRFQHYADKYYQRTKKRINAFFTKGEQGNG